MPNFWLVVQVLNNCFVFIIDMALLQKICLKCPPPKKIFFLFFMKMKNEHSLILMLFLLCVVFFLCVFSSVKHQEGLLDRMSFFY